MKKPSERIKELKSEMNKHLFAPEPIAQAIMHYLDEVHALQDKKEEKGGGGGKGNFYTTGDPLDNITLCSTPDLNKNAGGIECEHEWVKKWKDYDVMRKIPVFVCSKCGFW